MRDFVEAETYRHIAVQNLAPLRAASWQALRVCKHLVQDDPPARLEAPPKAGASRKAQSRPQSNAPQRVLANRRNRDPADDRDPNLPPSGHRQYSGRYGVSSHSTSVSTTKRFRVPFSRVARQTRCTSAGRRTCSSGFLSYAGEHESSEARQIEQRVVIAANTHAQVQLRGVSPEHERGENLLVNLHEVRVSSTATRLIP